MQDIRAVRSLALSSVMMVTLVVGLALHMQLPTSSVKKVPNEVKGVSTSASGALLWSGETRTGDYTNELVFPASSWNSLGKGLKKESLIKVKNPATGKSVIVTVAAVSGCDVVSACNRSYRIAFSSEIFGVLENKTGALKLDFSVPPLRN